MIRLLAIVPFTLLLGACASKPPLEENSDFAPIRPLEPSASALPTGSILGNSMHMSLFQGQRQWRVGDIITVVLNESTQASRNSSLITERKATNDALSSSWTDALLTPNGFWGDVRGDIDLTKAEIGSEGVGTAAQANALSGVITAMVAEVMPNGNLIVEGRKQLSLTEGAEFIQIRGVVRSRDVQPDNTVSSMRMAQAQISYRGTGNLAESTQPGWVTQLLYKYWPL
ncbi:MAG: flagellar basal body L-ring protein FlgH [Halieaceae bacterium]|jgi:flagellar L-ring protein precursor FlgH